MFRKALLAVVILFPIQSCMKEAHDNNDHKETISTLIYNVQFAAVRACSFLPAAQSIGALIAVAYPPSAAAGQIAEAICSAVKQAPVARGASTLSLSVNGVPVSGKLIQ